MTATIRRNTKKSAAPHKYFSLERSGSRASLVIYGDVTSWPWAESDVSSYNLSKQLEELDVDEIDVGINSYGGEIGEGLAIYNALKRHKAKVTTRCDGFACSIASVIFMAGDERVMADPSMLMIHNGWTIAEGDAKALRKQADDIEKMTQASVDIYMQHASIGEDELRALMDAETWISPTEAVDMGLATSVEGAETDKPSQSVRRKVMQMLKNPYLQLEEDEDEDDTTDKTDDENSGDASTDETEDQTETEDTSDETDTENQTDDVSEDETTETTDEDTTSEDDTTDETDDTEDEDGGVPQRRVLQFLNAISKM